MLAPPPCPPRPCLLAALALVPVQDLPHRLVQGVARDFAAVREKRGRSVPAMLAPRRARAPRRGMRTTACREKAGDEHSRGDSPRVEPHGARGTPGCADGCG